LSTNDSSTYVRLPHRAVSELLHLDTIHFISFSHCLIFFMKCN